MPQLTQLSLVALSQFFWLLIGLGFVYFVVARAMVPKIQATVDAREEAITGDLAAAQRAREDAEAGVAPSQPPLRRAGGEPVGGPGRQARVHPDEHEREHGLDRDGDQRHVRRAHHGVHRREREPEHGERQDRPQAARIAAGSRSSRKLSSPRLASRRRS